VSKQNRDITNLGTLPLSEVDARLAARGYVRIRVLASIVGLHITSVHRHVKSHKIPTLTVRRGASDTNRAIYVRAGKYADLFTSQPATRTEILTTLRSQGVTV